MYHLQNSEICLNMRKIILILIHVLLITTIVLLIIIIILLSFLMERILMTFFMFLILLLIGICLVAIGYGMNTKYISIIIITLHLLICRFHLLFILVGVLMILRRLFYIAVFLCFPFLALNIEMVILIVLLVFIKNRV